MKQIYLVFLMPIFKIKLSLTRNMSQHLRTCMGDTFAHDLHIFLVHRCTVASSSYIPTCTCTAKIWETVESCLQTPGEAHNCDAVNASLQDANMKACCELIQRDQHWLMTESSLGCWCTWGAETPFPASRMKVPWRSSDMRQWQKPHIYVTTFIPCFLFWARLVWEKDASIVLLCTKQTSCSSCTCVVDRGARWEQPLSSSRLLGCLKELETFKGTEVYNRKEKNMSFLSYTSVLLKSSSQDSQYPDFLLCIFFPVVVWRTMRSRASTNTATI